MNRRVHQLQFPLWAVLGLCLAIGSGCGGGSDRDEEKGSLHGKVTFNGGPVPDGSVLLLESPELGASRTATVQADGTYELSGSAELPVGTYKVALTPPNSGPTVDPSSANYDQMMSGGAGASNPNAAGFPVPERYRSTASSDKTIEVKAGSQEKNIDFQG